MSKGFRIALKVWLCLLDICLSGVFFLMALDFSDILSSLFAASFSAIACIGLLVLIIFWEKLTD